MAHEQAAHRPGGPRGRHPRHLAGVSGLRSRTSLLPPAAPPGAGSAPPGPSGWAAQRRVVVPRSDGAAAVTGGEPTHGGEDRSRHGRRYPAGRDRPSRCSHCGPSHWRCSSDRGGPHGVVGDGTCGVAGGEHGGHPGPRLNDPAARGRRAWWRHPAVEMRLSCLSDWLLEPPALRRCTDMNAGQRLEEAYRCLVALPVFKTGEAEDLGLAGSIPVRLRQHLLAEDASRRATPFHAPCGTPKRPVDERYSRAGVLSVVAATLGSWRGPVWGRVGRR
jgi:hypothetical protein